MKPSEFTSILLVQLQGMGGKVIVRAPTKIPHETIVSAIMETQNVDPGVLDAILNGNYEFQTLQTVTVERKDLESIIKGFYGVQEDSELSAFIEESEIETLFTKPESRPGPSRILSPVATTTAIDEDDSSIRPINQSTTTDTHTGEIYNNQRGQERKAVAQDEKPVEEAQKLVSRAPVACAMDNPRQNSSTGHRPIHLGAPDKIHPVGTPMIGILSGQRGSASDSPSPHSFVYYRGSCQDHQACQVPGAQVFPPPSDRRGRSQKITPITKRAYLKLE